MKADMEDQMKKKTEAFMKAYDAKPKSDPQLHP